MTTKTIDRNTATAGIRDLADQDLANLRDTRTVKRVETGSADKRIAAWYDSAGMAGDHVLVEMIDLLGEKACAELYAARWLEIAGEEI